MYTQSYMRIIIVLPLKSGRYPLKLNVEPRLQDAVRIFAAFCPAHQSQANTSWLRGKLNASVRGSWPSWPTVQRGDAFARQRLNMKRCQEVLA